MCNCFDTAAYKINVGDLVGTENAERVQPLGRYIDFAGHPGWRRTDKEHVLHFKEFPQTFINAGIDFSHVVKSSRLRILLNTPAIIHGCLLTAPTTIPTSNPSGGTTGPHIICTRLMTTIRDPSTTASICFRILRVQVFTS